MLGELRGLAVSLVAASAIVFGGSALAAPVLPIVKARRAADAESLAFTQKQPWGDSYRVKGCERGASPSVVFCHSAVRGLDPYQLNRLHQCGLTVKVRLLGRPSPQKDGVASRVVARRCNYGPAPKSRR